MLVKSSKIWKILWISGIYAILLLLLYLVIVYKVQWEDKDLNTYMYFYDCNHNLCTSTVTQDDYYGKVLCEDNNCPFITEIIGENVILNDGNVSWIYNYLKDERVNDGYLDYRYIGHNMFVVTDELSNQGIIDINNNLLVDPEYEHIDNYRSGLISYKKNGLYGIDSTNGIYQVPSEYEDIVLINDKIFAGMKDNVYYLYSYNDIGNSSANKYNYVYAFGDIILVIDNKKIDILDTNLKSTLLMKINTFYEYTTEKERESLNIYSDDENIYFRVFVNESEYTTYKYNIESKKLF